jgi:serine-type D-Ala-D-Ala carboxypeptidase (penicillin-binding protein 5/6)
MSAQLFLKPCWIVFVIVATLVTITPISGQHDSFVISPPNTCKAALVMELTSGDIIYDLNIHEQLEPASMVKMMLILITMERIKSGDISFDDFIRVSASASRIGGSQVYLKHNETFTLKELFESVLIQSANDSSYAIAEHIAGSDIGFVDLMNQRALQLGMTGTIFQSPHGLPPTAGNRDPDKSTAYDMAILAREILLHHPGVLEWTSMDTKTFRDGTFIMTNTNRLIREMEECDGLKTGYYRRAGFSITATAEQNGARIITVLFGCDNGSERFTEAARLLRWGLSLYNRYDLIVSGFPVEHSIPVLNGVKTETRPVARDDVQAVVPRDRIGDIVMRTTLENELTAPFEAGTICGDILFLLDERELGRSIIVTAESMEALGFWGKLRGKTRL